MVHALVDGLAKGVARPELLAEMERFLSQQTQLPPWLLARTRRALETMLSAAETWIAGLPADRVLSGSEVRLAVRVPPPIRGRPRSHCDDRTDYPARDDPR